MSRIRIAAIIAMAGMFQCNVRASAGTTLATQIVASGLSSPIMAKSPPGDVQRLFIVERAGKVRLVKNGVLQGTDFINLTGQVATNNERGMLDIAFHPNYSSNGFFYLRYNDSGGQTVIRRFTRSGNHDVADSGSGVNIMVLTSTISFHIGGSIEFGPDGFLYVTVGDAVDFGNPQNLDSLYGKILRIDVNGDDFPGDPNNNYRIPSGNPFAGATNGRDEIWALGLRNPYRMAFDRSTGALWIGDVANIGPEEIDFQPPGAGGRNYGWPCREGTTCNANQPECNCFDPQLIAPAFVYSHDGGHCAVTGGRIYRGCAIPDLAGTYFLGDYCSGNVWTFRYVNNQVTELNANRDSELDPPGSATLNNIVGFGEDAYGEIYICDLDGDVLKIVAATPPPDGNGNGIPDSCENGTPGDADGDGNVDVDDLLAVITSWGPCSGCAGDVHPHPNGNGTVNVDDLLLVLTNWS